MVPLKCGMTALTLTLIVLALILPYMVNGLNEAGQKNLSWILTLVVMSFFAIYSALVNSLLVGFISKFDDHGNYHLMSWFMFGCSVNSLTVLSFQVICLLALDNAGVYK